MKKLKILDWITEYDRDELSIEDFYEILACANRPGVRVCRLKTKNGKPDGAIPSEAVVIYEGDRRPSWSDFAKAFDSQ